MLRSTGENGKLASKVMIMIEIMMIVVRIVMIIILIEIMMIVV